MLTKKLCKEQKAQERIYRSDELIFFSRISSTGHTENAKKRRKVRKMRQIKVRFLFLFLLFMIFSTTRYLADLISERAGKLRTEKSSPPWLRRERRGPPASLSPCPRRSSSRFSSCSCWWSWRPLWPHSRWTAPWPWRSWILHPD